MNEQTIFTAAVERPPAERAAFLDDACGTDREIRERVEKLIELHEHAGDFLERPAVGAVDTLDQSLTERPGTVIGPYKLLQQIGEGGMGTVYMAEQSHPVQRKVALKVIKPGMDSSQVIARFEAERQALALMDHPNIAKVLDAGTTAAGRPYFVMELVKGVPITTYCDENHLPPKARLELFTQVCQAVQHAHHKGVIHRDLKPNNVLVALYDDKPVPKVIDFGVAKATGGRLTERTMFTGYGQIVGTLEYMSPEQARLNALDIDTRGDIYSLGVLLYELLTGTTPFDKKRLREAAFDEMLRIVREEEPPKPSTRLSTAEGRASIAANRSMEPNKLSGLIRGELDWIVMKALEKDRNRRYETANGFAADVLRYLHDEAVQACPPSAAYRLRKFARRNKGPVLTGTGVACALTLGLAASLWQWQRAERHLSESQENFEKFKEASARRDSLYREARLIAQQYSIFTNLTSITSSRSDWIAVPTPIHAKEREESYRRALAICEKLTAEFPDEPEHHRDLCRTLLMLEHVMREGDRHAEAETILRQAIAVVAGPHYPKDADAQNVSQDIHSRMIPVFLALGRIAESERASRKAIDLLEPLASAPSAPHSLQIRLADTYHSRALALAAAGRFDEAKNAFLRAIVLFENLIAEASPESVAEQQWFLASTYHDMGVKLREHLGPEEEEKAYRQAIACCDTGLSHSPDRIDTLWSLRHYQWELAAFLQRRGRLQEAEAAYRKALDLSGRLPPWIAGHRAPLKDIIRSLAELLTATGRPHEAEKVYGEAIELYRRLPVRGSEEQVESYLLVGELLRHSKKTQEAENVYRQAIALLEKLAAEFPGKSEYRQSLANAYHHQLSNLYHAAERPGETEKAFRQALPLWENLVAELPAVWDHRYNLAEAYQNLGQYDRATAEYTKAIEIDPKQAQSWYGRGCTYVSSGEIDKATNDLTKAIELKAKFWEAWHWRGKSYSRAGKWDKALGDYSKSIEVNPNYAHSWLHRAAAHAKLDQPDQAVADLKQASVKGFKDTEYLKNAAEFSPLHAREDFQKLLAELETKRE